MRGKMRNMHVYTESNDDEICLEARLGEILNGKHRKMDEDNPGPLRVIWIPGKKGRFYQPFPSVSGLCGARKRDSIVCLRQRSPMILRSKNKRFFIRMIYKYALRLTDEILRMRTL